MAMIDRFTAFWSVTVNPDSISKVTVPRNATASLTAGAAAPPDNVESGRVVLYVKVNNGPEAAIFPFTIGKFESASTDLFFADDDVLEFYTKGDKIPVHISGYITNGFSLNIEEAKH
ncbi:hypothetical protein M9Y10_034609 [Tritrichomonas musculus]|uniref:Nucleoplasmin-like domain-containing protein n=1 Tax=Tritrichomonas musculus TaxID=1915356 RepID=A0ABR2KFH5_9EUKA